ncbi:MAG: OmpA family protein [Bacteroidetes bacterium]|nr:OmpA family protein [Bacteroidota bacterium]
MLQLSLFINICNAQKTNSYHKAADAKFQKQLYEQAGILYLRALAVDVKNDSIVYPFIPYNHKYRPSKVDDNPAYLTYQVAECFRKLGDYINAARMYEKFFRFKQEGSYPLSKFWYAQCLKNSNNPALAIEIFKDFIAHHQENDNYTQSAKEQVEECRTMIDITNSKQKPIITKLAQPINGVDNSFALQQYNDSLFLFSSVIPDTIGKRVKYPLSVYWGNFNNLKEVQKTIINGKSPEMAASSLSPDGLTLYFTAWKTKNTNAIYYIKRTSINAEWSKPTEMEYPVNEKHSSAKHPFITNDGKYLLFTSNRQGSIGGFDIWFVELKDGKIITDAKNVGYNINTTDDEISPYYNNEQNILYFSSHRKDGIGGFDVYSSNGNLTTNKWQKAELLSYPINTPKDELYYKQYNTTAYISSNRQNDNSLEIYSIISEKQQPTETVVATNTDTTTVTTSNKKTEPTNTTDTTEATNKNETSTKTNTPTWKHIVDSLNSKIESRYCIYFKLNSSAILNQDMPTLDSALTQLKHTPELNIIIGSFTDCKGKEEANRTVAIRRSKAVKDFLIKKGIEREKIHTYYFIAKHYVKYCADDSSYNEAEQMQNRRADILLTKEKNADWVPSGKEIDIIEILDGILKKTQTNNTSTYPARLIKNATKAKAKTNNKINLLTTGNPKKQPISEEEMYTNKIIRTPETTAKSTEINSTENTDTTHTKQNATNKHFSARLNKQPFIIYTLSDSVKIDFYDDGLFDYDSISVFYNKHLVIHNQLLQTDKPLSFTASINNNPNNNILILFAENLGQQPPNTALVIITDATGKRTAVELTSDLQNNAVIQFVKGKKTD